MYDIFVVKSNKTNNNFLSEQYPHCKTVEYSSDKKELFKQIAMQSATKHAWIVSESCDYREFDFNYTPPWHQADQIHVWPTNKQHHGGDTCLINAKEFLKQYDNIDYVQNYQSISWKSQSVKQVVNPEVFVWSRSSTADMIIDDATFLRYIGDPLSMLKKTIRRATTPYIWIISDECNYSEFDFNWRPDWEAESYLHVWPTENQQLGGDTYYVNVEEFKKQQDAIEKIDHYETIQWHSPVKQNNKPAVYIWDKGNSDNLKKQFPDAQVLRYVGSTLDMVNKTIRNANTPYVWILSSNCNYTNFDFNWRPGWAEENFLHVWPTDNQCFGGDTFYINVSEFKKQSFSIESIDQYQTINWHHNNSVASAIKNEIFVWDKGNAEYIKQIIPDAVVLRHFGTNFDMMKRTVAKSNTANFWVISDNCNYTNFDFKWRPSWATENHMHVWPIESQQSGGSTYYVNKAEFQKQSFEINNLNDYRVVNWHKESLKELVSPDVVVWDSGNSKTNIENIKEKFPNAIVLRNVGSRFDMINRSIRHIKTNNAWVISSKCNYNEFDFTWRPDWATEKHIHVWPTENQNKGGDTFFIDVAEFQKQSINISRVEEYNDVTWHKQNVSLYDNVDIILWSFGGNTENLNKLKNKYPHAKTLRYIGTHLDMVKKSAKYTDSDYFWILSDCCDYKDFSSNWRPDWEEENSIHCWASGDQKFGDTFFIPKAEFLKEADALEKLEYYSSIIWHKEGYARYPWPVNYADSEDLFTTLKNHKFSSIYEYFVMPGSTIGSDVDPSLWEKRLLIAYNKNGHVSLCPRDCISEISTKVRDYPYIKYHKCKNSTQKPQDIVFISYDEINADLNYEKLKKRFPNAMRIHGVKGNVQAYKAAAKLSTTPWYYAVFPKTVIDDNFNFNTNPDYLETPGHYIFNATNVVTDNCYGHGGVKMYHVKTTIEIENWGFDFTMSSPVTSIPVNSCFIEPADDYEAWRTAFREALKLRDQTDVESQYRLHKWLTVGNGPYGEASKNGAAAALEYNGDLTLANSWEWLREQFERSIS